MNENTMSETNGDLFGSQSSNSNDVVDLTEISSDEIEVTSSSMYLATKNLRNSQQPESRLENSEQERSNSSADDSICILYEKILPPPDVAVVNEVIINNSNGSFDDDAHSTPIPPVIMGSYSYIENSDAEYGQIPPLFPEISNERTSSSSQSLNFNYAEFYKHNPYVPRRRGEFHLPPPPLPVRLPRSRTPSPEPLNLKTVPHNLPSCSSVLEKPNIEDKAPKIQCGICLDGPEEIAASGRNFTSTNCGHVFCNECIKTSLKNANKCPKCRKKVTTRQIHPLYL